MAIPEKISFTSNGHTYELSAKEITDNKNGAAGAKKDDYYSSNDISIFTNVFDKNKDGTLDTEEAESMQNTLWNDVDADHDGNITENEAKSFLAKFGNKLKDVTPSKFLEFLSGFGKEKTEDTAKETKWNSYTVQNGESYKNLIIRSLKAQGIENPTQEQIEKGMEDFEAKNPNAVKTSKKGVKYLLVGEKVQVAGGLEDKNNSDEQIQAWTETINAQKAAKRQNKNEKITTRATYVGNVVYDEKTKTHYFKNDDGTLTKFDTYNNKKVVQFNKDCSFYTHTDSKSGKSYYSTLYDRSGNIIKETNYDKKTGRKIEESNYSNDTKVKSQFYNDKNQCIEVAYFDSNGRKSSGKGYNGKDFKSYTTDFNTSIRTFVRTDGSKYYYKVDKYGNDLFQCDKNGKKI